MNSKTASGFLVVSLFLACALIPLVAADPVQNGLVGWWKFDEASGSSVADSSGRGHAGTISGGVMHVNGKIGGALDFDGSSGYVTVPDAPDFHLTNGATLEAWVNFHKIGGVSYDAGYPVVSKWNRNVNTEKSYALSVLQARGAQNARFLIQGADLTYVDLYNQEKGDLTVGEWHHVVGVFDGANKKVKLYVDDALSATAGVSFSTLFDVSKPLTIGWYSGDYNFNGSIDEVRVYNRALSPSEVMQNYNYGGGAPAFSCTDSDGYRTTPQHALYDFTKYKGVTTANNQPQQQYLSHCRQSGSNWICNDYCSSTWLIEFNCDSQGHVGTAEYNCAGILGSGYSCSDGKCVQNGSSPTPTPSIIPANGCLISPSSGAIQQGGSFNFVVSCFDASKQRTDCPAITWAMSGLTGVTKNTAASTHSVTLAVPENAIAPQNGLLRASGTFETNPALPTATAEVAGANELSFASLPFSCEIPISVSSACINGFQTEQRTLGTGEQATIGKNVFYLKDLSVSSKAVVLAKRTASDSNAWDLCGNEVQCVANLSGGALSMPIGAAANDVEAKVWFLQYVTNPAIMPSSVANSAEANELSFDSSYPKAVLKIMSSCETVEASCSVTPNYYSATGPFSKTFSVSFKNIFGPNAVPGSNNAFTSSYKEVTFSDNAVAAPNNAVNGPKAMVYCKQPASSDTDTAQEVAITQSGSGGTASFTCDYPNVTSDATFLVNVVYGAAKCGAQVLDKTGGSGSGDGIPQILSPKNGDEYWGERISLKYVIPSSASSGAFQCQYAVYGGSAPAKFSELFAAQPNVESSVMMTIKPGGHWVAMRCQPVAGATAAPWRTSNIVSFKAYEADRPILIEPSSVYHHFGLNAPVRVKYEIAGTTPTYACTFVLDGTVYSLGTVRQGENSFNANPPLPASAGAWRDGAEHLLSVRCAPQTNAVPPATSEVAAASELSFAAAWPQLRAGEKESAILKFKAFEADKPVILTPIEAGVYNSPTELAFVVGGTSAAYACIPVFDSIDSSTVYIAAGEVTKIYKVFASGKHKAKVKCMKMNYAQIDENVENAAITAAAGAVELDGNDAGAVAGASSSELSFDSGIVTDGLVGYWNFDEASGATAFDKSDYDNDGSVMGAARVQGKVGGGLQFDGVNDFVRVPDSTSLKPESAVTMEAWIYPTRYAEQYVIQKALGGSGGSYRIGLKAPPNTDLMHVYTEASGVAYAAYNYAYLDKWTHFVGIVDWVKGKEFIFLNGALVKEKTFSPEAPPYSSDSLFIGNVYGTKFFFKGLIDEVKIYDRALSASEVLQNYNYQGGSSSPTPTPTPTPTPSPSPTPTASPTPSPTPSQWVSSAEVTFLVINKNQPVIISPKQDDLLTNTSVNFTFTMGGDALAYDCTGVLKSLDDAPFKKDVDFGRVTRPSCALPGYFGKIVSDVPIGKYEARVTCTPNYAIACGNALPEGGSTSCESITILESTQQQPRKGDYIVFSNGFKAVYQGYALSFQGGTSGGYFFVSTAFDIVNSAGKKVDSALLWVNYTNGTSPATSAPYSKNGLKLSMVSATINHETGALPLNFEACPDGVLVPVSPSSSPTPTPSATPTPTPTPTPSPTPDITTGLVAYYSFDDCTANDSSGNGFDGINYGASCVDGVNEKKAFSFDGSTDKVQLPNQVVSGKTITFSAWIKTSDDIFGIVTGAKTNVPNEYLLFHGKEPSGRSSNRLLKIYYHGDDFHETPAKVDDGVWHLLTVVTTESQSKVYVDGVLNETSQFGSGNGFSVEGLWLAAEQDSVNGGWDPVQALNGLLDEVKFFNRALTADEVKAEYRRVAGLSGASELVFAGATVATELFFADYTSDPVNFEVGGRSASPTPTPSATPTPSVTPTPSTTPTPSETPTPSTTPAPSPTPASGGGGGNGYYYGRPCNANSDCGAGSVCVSGYCAGCLCISDNECNLCCIAGTDKDCAKNVAPLGAEPTLTPDESDFWPTVTPVPYNPAYSLKLKCAVGEGASKKVTAILTVNGVGMCDENMRFNVDGKNLAPDASACAGTGTHYFDVSGLAGGEFTGRASSLGGSTSSCKLAIASVGGNDWLLWLVLAIVIIAIAGGAYYYKKKQDEKNAGGSGGAGGAGGDEIAAEESMDLLEEA